MLGRAIKATTRAAAPVRRMGGAAHAHGAPSKVLPPRCVSYHARFFSAWCSAPALQVIDRTFIHLRCIRFARAPPSTYIRRPELSPKASIGERIEHALWYKRNPNYEGAEAYARFYLPHNYQVRFCRGAGRRLHARRGVRREARERMQRGTIKRTGKRVTRRLHDTMCPSRRMRIARFSAINAMPSLDRPAANDEGHRRRSRQERHSPSREQLSSIGREIERIALATAHATSLHCARRAAADHVRRCNARCASLGFERRLLRRRVLSSTASSALRAAPREQPLRVAPREECPARSLCEQRRAVSGRSLSARISARGNSLHCRVRCVR